MRIEFVQILSDVVNDLAGSARPVEIKLFGPDLAALEAYGTQLDSAMTSIAGLEDLFSGVSEPTAEMAMRIDATEANQVGLTPAAVTQAVNFYVNLVKQYGEPGASNDSFNQLLTLYGQGKCAMWYDATVAATSIATTYPAVYAQTGYALAPVDKTQSSGWLWTWALGIPQGSTNSGAAWKWVSWATSKQYDTLVGQKYGWAAVPPGTRTSLYSNPSYTAAAKPFAAITLQSINGVDPNHPTLNPVPYVGIQYVDIPQFESLGVTVGQQIAGAIAGTESVSQALQAGQSAASQYTPIRPSGNAGSSSARPSARRARPARRRPARRRS